MSSSIESDSEMSDFNALEQIPDLRFEQAFTKSYKESSGTLVGLAKVLILDQIILPLIQGSLWGVGVSVVKSLLL